MQSQVLAGTTKLSLPHRPQTNISNIYIYIFIYIIICYSFHLCISVLYDVDDMMLMSKNVYHNHDIELLVWQSWQLQAFNLN